MGLLDLVLDPLRSVVGSTARAVAGSAPARGLAAEEHRLADRMAAVHRAAEALEGHALVLESLASAIPALAASVDRLTERLDGLDRLLSPLAGVEREIGRVERLFGRHRHEPSPPGGDAAG